MYRVHRWLLGSFLAMLTLVVFGVEIAFAQQQQPTIQTDQVEIAWGEVLQVQIMWPEVVTVTEGVTPTVRINSLGEIQETAGCEYIARGLNSVSCDRSVEIVEIKAIAGSRVLGVGLALPTSPTQVQRIVVPVIPSGVDLEFKQSSILGTPTQVECTPFGGDFRWSCSLPVGTLWVNPPTSLTTIWGMLQQPTQQIAIYRFPPLVFPATLVTNDGTTVETTCSITRETWDFSCDLPFGGTFTADYHAYGEQ